MYKEYFHFSRSPFLNTADPVFYFNSRTHREALAAMLYGVREGKGFVMITGGIGTGKTMLVQAMRAELGTQHLLIDISTPWISPDEVFAAIWREIGLPGAAEELIARDRLSALKTMKERLLKLDAEGRRVVLIIDEAHQLPERTLEGIRLFSDMETHTRKLLQVILLGQEELQSALKGHALRALRDRIALSHHLEALSAADTEEYIHHRIRAAGGNPGIFNPECFPIIYEITGGCPRPINYLCDQCLLFAFGKSQYQIDVALLREVAARLQLRSGFASDARAGLGAAAQPTNVGAFLESQKVRAAARDATDIDDDGMAGDERDYSSLPFQIPDAMHKENYPSRKSIVARSEAEPPPIGGFRFSQVMLTLAAGLLIGAVVVWLVAGKAVEFRLPFSLAVDDKAQEAPKTAPVKPGNPPMSSVPTAAEQPIAPAPEMRAITPPVQIAPVGPKLPLLSGTASADKRSDVAVTPNAGMAMLASQQYGAWNSTVRDIIAEANPSLGDLEKLPDGTRVYLPKLSRNAMVVSDDGAHFYIFYGSFESQDAAARDAETLKRLSTPSIVTFVERAGARIYRLYVGPYISRNDADTVANSLWFRYLPGLS